MLNLCLPSEGVSSERRCSDWLFSQRISTKGGGSGSGVLKNYSVNVNVTYLLFCFLILITNSKITATC